jgi:hypothetical protein
MVDMSDSRSLGCQTENGQAAKHFELVKEIVDRLCSNLESASQPRSLCL